MAPIQMKPNPRTPDLFAVGSGALPSTSSLRAFETAARLLSFTAAAAELSQTQGAISHQIRELESRFNVRLFERVSRGITLSEAGKTYLPYVCEALDRLRAGEQAIRPSPSSNVLTVSCSPNFAQKWLVPRLGQFMADNPGVDLRISAIERHVNFDNDGIDVAVRHGDGQWPDLTVTRLCQETVFPVCSPHLQPSVQAIREIADLSRFVLIHDQQRAGWAEWLHALQVDVSQFPIDRGPRFSSTSLAIDAALAGQGIALARSALVQLDLSAGRLIRPLTAQVEADFSYWIVCPGGKADVPRIRKFSNWLIAQASPGP